MRRPGPLLLAVAAAALGLLAARRRRSSSSAGAGTGTAAAGAGTPLVDRRGDRAQGTLPPRAETPTEVVTDFYSGRGSG